MIYLFLGKISEEIDEDLKMAPLYLLFLHKKGYLQKFATQNFLTIIPL